jgi:hypothetical protein
VLNAMRLLISEQAALFDASIESLREADPAALPPHLLPLYLAQSTLDGPDNPNSLRAIVEGTAPLIGHGPGDIALTDALLARIGLLALVSERRAALPTATASMLRGQSSASWSSSGAPFTAGDDAMSAAELDRQMNIAAWGRANTEGASGDVLDKVGVVIGLGGLVPNPVGKAASAAAGSALFGMTKGAEAAAKLLPSKFDSMEFELTHGSLLEDDPRVGEWSNVSVVASSEGWRLDKALVETLLQFVRAKGSYDSWLTAFQPPGLRESLDDMFRDYAVDAAVAAWGDAAGIITIPPRQFGPVDITAEPWSEAQVSFALEAVGRQGYRLDSSWEGGLEAEIELRTTGGPSRFGNRGITRKRAVRIDPVTITFDPTRRPRARPDSHVPGDRARVRPVARDRRRQCHANPRGPQGRHAYRPLHRACFGERAAGPDHRAQHVRGWPARQLQPAITGGHGSDWQHPHGREHLARRHLRTEGHAADLHRRGVRCDRSECDVDREPRLDQRERRVHRAGLGRAGHYRRGERSTVVTDCGGHDHRRSVHLHHEPEYQLRWQSRG